MINRLMGIARYTIGKVVDFPLPSKEVMRTLGELKDQMTEVKSILEDGQNTTIRLVLNPERMAINETRRSYSYMCLYNKNVECLVINKVIPEDADGEFMRVKLSEQKEYMQMIHDSFEPLKMMTAHMLRTEMRGIEKLEMLADMIFGDSDPIETYSGESPMKFYSDSPDTATLKIKMPFVEQDQIDLYKGRDNTIILQIGSQRRTVSLPMTLANAELLGAEFGDSCLYVRFKR
jgi:arsenite-transporting ATPase